jgi:hypothetical protein
MRTIILMCCLIATPATAQVNVPLACRDLAIRAGYHSATLSSEQAQRAYQELGQKDPNNPDVRRCKRAVDARIQRALEDTALTGVVQ